jgi:hypothetical protein
MTAVLPSPTEVETIPNATLLLSDVLPFNNVAPSSSDVTALCVHMCCVCVGTSDGDVLLFDHDETLRRRLSSVSAEDVTAIAVSRSGALVAFGLSSGGVHLWSTAHADCGLSLCPATSPSGLHRRITSLFVVGDGPVGTDASVSVLCVDSTGTLCVLRPRKVGWPSATVAVDVECLVPGSPEASPSSSSSALAVERVGEDELHLVAFAGPPGVSPSCTVVAQWDGGESFHVFHRWKSAPSTTTQQSVSLAWGSRAATATHLLLRAAGSCIQVLAVAGTGARPIG